MGSSCWTYVAPFDPDLATVLERLRRRVFDEQEFYFLPGDDGWPDTIEALWADEYVQEGGTHSILDIFRVIGPDDVDAYGTLRPLRPAELRRYFDTVTPTRPVFELAYAQSGDQTLSRQGQRWSGYSTVLYDDRGDPVEVAIWGFSGD